MQGPQELQVEQSSVLVTFEYTAASCPLTTPIRPNPISSITLEPCILEN